MASALMAALISVVSAIFMILLGVIGYFLKGVHTELHKVSEAVVKMTTRVALTEEKGKSGHRMLQDRIAGVEKRIEKLETRIYV